MKDKSLKQMSTSIIPQGNVPNVPAHLQTGTYYPQTPPPIANPMGVAGMEAQNDMTGYGMGNQMGTYPLAQGVRFDKEKYYNDQMGNQPLAQEKTSEYKEFQRDSANFVQGLQKGYIDSDIKAKYPLNMSLPPERQKPGSMKFYEEVKIGYSGKKTK